MFGRTVVGAVPPPHEIDGPASPRLLIERLPVSPVAHGVPPVISVRMEHPEGTGQYEVWVDQSRLVLRVSPLAEFECTVDRIGVFALPHVSLAALQWQVYGLVISAWSEWIGNPVLHAAVIDVEGGAVGLFGASGAGKSSAALEFVRAGYRALGDDQLIVGFEAGGSRAHPAVPWFKLDDLMAARVVANPASLPLIHPAARKRRYDLPKDVWADASLPIRCGFVLDRNATIGAVHVVRLSPAEALIEMLRHTYLPRTTAAAGLAGRRLLALSQVARQVPMFTVSYPDGEQWLPVLRAAMVGCTRTGSGGRLASAAR